MKNKVKNSACTPEKPVAYVDFDRCIVCVDPNAPLVPDDRSERQKQWDAMVMSCEVSERDDGFFVDLRVHHHFFAFTLFRAAREHWHASKKSKH